MSSGEVSSNQATAKSPILAAIAISLAIAGGTVFGTTDSATLSDAATGKWLTRPLAEANERNTASIATLEKTIGALVRDIDFIANRASVSIRRSEGDTSDRLAQLDAEIAALKDRIAGIQAVRLAPRAEAPVAIVPVSFESGDVTGLRSSLHDLATAHSGAVSAITKRLDRIEVMVGLSTDMTSSVADPAALAAARRAEAKPVKKPIAQPAPVPAPFEAAAPNVPERGHLFNVKPVSQQSAPLRLSKLPG